MKTAKKCLICGITLIDTSVNQNRLYCSPKCRYTAGNERRRLKKLEPKIYKVKCGKCEHEWRFDFCPIKSYKRFLDLSCPKCKTLVRSEIRKAKDDQGFSDMVASISI